MFARFFILLALASIVSGQFGPAPSPSSNIPGTVIEPEVVVQRKDWENRPFVPSPFGIPAIQTDSTFREPLPLSVHTPADEVDFIGNNYVFGRLHDTDTLGADVDYYVYNLTGEGASAIYNAPYFGYPLIPACKSYLDVELVVLLVGPDSVPDSFIGTLNVDPNTIPSRVQIPSYTKILSSSKLVVDDVPCNFYEPTLDMTFCSPASILPGCASGFPATTVKTSPPYTPYCNFTDALSANYDAASTTGVFGEWPAGLYTIIVYEVDAKPVDYTLHLGYRGLFEASFIYFGDLDVMPGNLAISYGESISWLNTARYGSTISLDKCKAIH